MRPGFALLMCACGFAAGFDVSAAEFPYQATVSQNNVVARSGPSYGVYPTERLPKGSQVEVHRDGDNGWVAIRPLPNAFDWVPASSVKLTSKPQVAQVIVETPAVIGSNVKRAEKHTSQVTLKVGEAVKIVGEKEVAGESGAKEKWYKIAPPAGEFRWVQKKFLSDLSPEEFAAEEARAKAEREAQLHEAGAPGLLAKLFEGNDEEQTVEVSGDVAQVEFPGRKAFPQMAARENTKPSTTRDPRVSLDPRALPSRLVPPQSEPIKTEPVSALPERVAEANAAPRELPKPIAPRVSLLNAEEFKQMLAELDVDLTTMVAEDQSKWQLSGLQKRAETLVAQGPTALDRGKARLVMERIAEFESTLPPNFEETPSSPSPGSNAANVAGGAVAATSPRYADAMSSEVPRLDAHYDAVGFLMPVVGAGKGVPPFQLVDKDGRTLKYVSPAPGVNLQRFVKKQIGVYGQCGYMEMLKKQHVLVEKVVELEKHGLK